MTPTLPGRWQTRIALLWSLGLIVTAGWMWYWDIFALSVDDLAFWQLPILLGYVTLLGLGWDILYTYLQGFRWDADWPLAFHFGAGIFEGIVVFLLFRFDVLPGLTYHPGDGWRFLLHYASVFGVTYWWVYGPMRVLFPRWRFNGGELI